MVVGGGEEGVRVLVVCVVLELYLGYFSARFNCLLYISWLKFSGMGYLHLNMHLESLVEACNWLL